MEAGLGAGEARMEGRAGGLVNKGGWMQAEGLDGGAGIWMRQDWRGRDGRG